MKEPSTLEQKNKIDMLQGPLLSRMITFAIPIMITSILQQLFNAADVAILGKFAGSQAMAAVGSNAPIINLIINLLMGLSIGANVVIANYIGQTKHDKVNAAIHTTIMIAILGGITVGIIGILAADPMLHAMDVPNAVKPLAFRYLIIYFTGTPLMMIYNFGASILRSKGDTLRPLICLIISGFVKIGLNLLFVIVLSMSVGGVAFATVIANTLSALLVVRILMKESGEFKLSPKKLRIHREALTRILKIGVPSGIQATVFSLSNVFIQFAINGFGSEAIAGSSAALYAEYISYFVLTAFIQTTMTFTSQNFGAKNMARCRQIFLRGMLMGLAALVFFDLLFLIAREPFIGIFTSEPAVAQWAYIRLFRILTFQWMVATYEISGAALRGMGHSMLPAIITAFGTCVLRIAWIFTVFQQFKTFEMLLNIYPITWVVTGSSVTIVYFIVRKKEEARILTD